MLHNRGGVARVAIIQQFSRVAHLLRCSVTGEQEPGMLQSKGTWSKLEVAPKRTTRPSTSALLGCMELVTFEESLLRQVCVSR